MKVLDFGIARLAGGGLAPTRTGVAVGTPAYMAPEQARGVRDVDLRADLFSLGCVLYECLTGRPPFAAESAVAVLAKILFEPAPRLSELRPEAPPALDDLVARLLAKEPAERPPDAAAVAAFLDDVGRDAGDARGRRSVRLPALTTGENRLVALVLAGAPGAELEPGDVASSPTIRPTDTVPSLDGVREAAERHHARLERLADGSLVVPLVGARTALDLAVQAARCGLSLHAAAPHLRVALAMGRGDVSGGRPVGEVIDRAAALLAQAAGAGEVRIDETIAGFLDARFETRGDALGLVLLGERPQAIPTRTLLGKPTPSVGRERELAVLTGLFEESAAESVARVMLITAPPGVGKSRVRYEFQQYLARRTEPVDPWIAFGDPMHAGAPFGLIAPLLRRAAGISEGEGAAVKRRKLHARVARHAAGADLERVVRFLGELTGAALPDEDSEELRAARRDPMVMADQLRRAWEDFLAGETGAGPVVLVLEDLHWGDLPTVRLIDAALRRLADRPLFVLAPARPEVHDLFPRLWAERGVQELRLVELTRRAGEKLVRAVLGDGVHPAVVAKLLDTAGGNAFYLEELIRAYAEAPAGELPSTVLAMAQARLEALEPEARRILRAGSVFGQVFWRGGVTALLGGERAAGDVGGWLETLATREVVTRRGASRFAGDDEYVFRHALVHQAAYAMLTDHDRLLGHRLAGGWLLAAGDAEPLALAEHFERGGEAARAVEWYLRSAEQALEGNDYAAATVRAERGAAAGATGELLGRLRRVQGRAGYYAGDYPRAIPAWQEALAQFRPGSTEWYDALSELSVCAGKSVRGELVESCWVRAMAQEPDPAARGDRVACLAQIVAMMIRVGLGGGIEEPLRAVRELAAGTELSPLGEGRVCWMEEMAAGVKGDVGALLAVVDRAQAVFLRGGDLRSATSAVCDRGWALCELGDFTAAEAFCRRAIAEAERLAIPVMVGSARQNLGRAIARGPDGGARLAEAEREIELSMVLLRETGDVHMYGWSVVYAGDLALRRRDLAGARRRAESVLTPEQSAAVACGGLAILAQVHLAERRAEEALAAATRAVEQMAAAGGIDEGATLIRLVHAEALHAAGRLADARAAITAAREHVLRAADRIEDPGWRRSFLENVPENRRTLERAAGW